MYQRHHYLAAACAAVLLLSCAADGGRQASPAAPSQPVAAADGYYRQGRDHFAAGRVNEALVAYGQALAIDPGHIDARNGLAVLYAGQGQYQRAIALWLAMSEEPGPPPGFLFGNLGYAYFLAGEHERALTALEKACLLDPASANSWQHLGQVLVAMGQGDRAARMFRQAETLRRHDAGADYALARATAAPALRSASPPATGAAAIDLWPADGLRTELRQRGDGLVELRRVGAAVEPGAPVAQTAPIAAIGTAAAPRRVEIRNGNGVPGMAAALARVVNGVQWRVVRLTNDTPFTVARSRIEYRAGQEAAAKSLASGLGPLALVQDGDCRGADLCLVLGRDFANPAALRRYFLKQSKDGKAPVAPVGYSQLTPPMPLLLAMRLAGLP